MTVKIIRTSQEVQNLFLVNTATGLLTWDAEYSEWRRKFISIHATRFAGSVKLPMPASRVHELLSRFNMVLKREYERELSYTPLYAE